MCDSADGGATLTEEQKMSRNGIRNYVLKNYKHMKENHAGFNSLNYYAKLESGCFVEFECIPFDAGSMQLAFKAELLKPLDGNLRRSGQKRVVKVPQSPDTIQELSSGDRINWLTNSALKSVERHKKAIGFAEEFNKLRVSKSVEVVEIELAQITRTPEFNNESKWQQELVKIQDHLKIGCLLFDNSYVTAEPFITGKFAKYLDNDGNRFSASNLNLPSAFAHWTWQNSGGKFMICDIQGVRKGTKYVLTDPCVHSSRESGINRFGLSDLGEEGMRKFFQKHVCNDLCRGLYLVDIRSGESLDDFVTLCTRRDDSFVKNMRFDILSWDQAQNGNPGPNSLSPPTGDKTEKTHVDPSENNPTPQPQTISSESDHAAGGSDNRVQQPPVEPQVPPTEFTRSITTSRGVIKISSTIRIDAEVVEDEAEIMTEINLSVADGN